MNCVITAGPTYEPLDDVRRLTNFSTGTLGTEFANFLVSRGHHVTLLLAEQATFPGPKNAQQIISFGTTEDLQRKLTSLSNQPVDALFHAAAVSDFRFGRIWRRLSGGELVEVNSGKISSRTDGLLAELIPTPKIIRSLRTWFPHARLTGWKYEVDGEREDAIAQAKHQMEESHTDACVVNGPAYGAGFGFVVNGEPSRHLADSAALFQVLEDTCAK